MNGISFQWDERKNQNNIKKHRISFEEARAVFDDDLAIIFDDPDHSVEEERFLIIGLAGIKQICLVSYCYREHGDVIRIISARKATPKEKRIYFERIE